MPSPSMTGRPACAAVMIGSIALAPPISAAISRRHLDARGFLDGPHRAVALGAFLEIFSTPTTGAPMPPTSPTQASSGSASSGSTRPLAPLAEQFARAQHADIGIAAAAGAEQRRADRQRQQIGFRQVR